MEKTIDKYDVGEDLFEEIRTHVLKGQRLHRYFLPKLVHLYENKEVDFQWEKDSYDYTWVSLEDYKIYNVHWAFALDQSSNITVYFKVAEVEFMHKLTAEEWKEIPSVSYCGKFR